MEQAKPQRPGCPSGLARDETRLLEVIGLTLTRYFISCVFETFTYLCFIKFTAWF